MSLLLTALVVVSAILMVGVILLQQGKGAELGAAFGRGAQGGLFGATGTANFLTRTTKWLAVAFFGAALTLSLFVSDSSREGVLDELRGGEQSESVLIEEDAESAADAEAEAVDSAGAEAEADPYGEPEPAATEEATAAEAEAEAQKAEETRTPD